MTRQKWIALIILVVIAGFAGVRVYYSSVNKIRYTDQFIWQQSPSDDLSVAGAGKTITLSPCPVGLDATATANKLQYVYIATVGTPEAAPITSAGTCTPNKSTGTVIVTTVNAHAAGYTVGTASSGIQEAVNDAGSPMGRVVITPSRGQGPAGNAWPIYGPVIVQNNQLTLEGDGAAVNCFTRSRCIQFGSLASSTAFGGNTIRGLRFASSVANTSVAITNTECSSNTATITVSSTAGFVTGDMVDIQYTGRTDYWGGTVGTNNAGITVTDGTHFTFAKTGCSLPSEASGGWAALMNAAIEDNVQALSMENIFFSRPGGITGKFSNGIVIDNDQAAKVLGLNTDGPGSPYCSGGGYCGQVVYAPGPFATNAAVVYIDKANFNMQCNGNAINNLGGNTLSVNDSVVQGYSQFGINTGVLKGGFGPTTITNVYQEVGACQNLNYPGTGLQQRAQVGIMNWGTVPITIRGGEAPLGQIPKFAATGNNGTQYNYYVVIHDSTEGVSSVLPVGYATVDSATPTGSITVSWPRVQGTATVTYDVLRNSGTSNTIVAPYNGGCTGGSTTACGSVTTAQAQCSTFLCSFTDDASVATTSYAVTAMAYYPKLNFWPGSLVLNPNVDAKTDTPTGAAYIDGTEFLTNTSPIISVYGTAAPSVFADRCDVSTPGIWVVCISGNSSGAGNPAIVGTLFQNGTSNSGSVTANLTGRLGIVNTASGINTGHLITLVYSDQNKMLNSPYYRPTNENNDTFIGLDNGNVTRSQARLAFGAPLSLSNYIGNKGDGTSYKERLTSTEKTFTVPVQLTPVAFSALAACAAGTEGQHAAVNDSSTDVWGATVTGGSTLHILAYCDGTNWTVAAK